MDDDQQFCLRWNNHQSTLISVFDTLLEKGIHVDCTLAAEGQTLKAHKVVLSACSPYFESVLSQQYDKHPIIILKDVKYAELRAMMDYMYRGEVNISQDQLAALLKAAESLQIKGLSDNKPPPRTSSPSLKGRVLETASTGHLHSREGSSSPAPRKRKKPRRASADSININSSEHIPSQNHTPIQPPAPIKNNIEHIDNDVVVPIKVNKVSNDIANDVMKNNNKSEVADDAKLEFEEGNEDSVEDLTLDEEADSEIDSAHPISAGPSIGQGDVVQSFQWHMERSQDEVINAQDSQRDSQDASVQTLDSNKEIKNLLGVPVIDLDLETSLLDEEFDGDESDSSILQFSNKKYLILKPDDEELKQLISNTVQNNLIPSVETKTEDTVSSGLDDSKENDKVIMNESPIEEKGESKKRDAEMSSPQQPSLPCAQYATPKGYKCPNCQRIYNARKNLVRHINLECGREPQYKCPYCSHGNHRRNELKRHIQKKHPDKPDCDVPSKVAC